jgi:hypothetical protein
MRPGGGQKAAGVLVGPETHLAEEDVMGRKKGLVAVSALAAGYLASASAVNASVHGWQISEIYRNSDGSVQFIELQNILGDGENQFAGFAAKLNSTDGVTTNVFSFPTNTAFNTASKRIVIATAGFAGEAGGLTPDFTLPANFLFPAGGTVSFTANLFGTIDSQTHPALPAYRQSLNGSNVAGLNSPTNFAGTVGSITSAVSLSAAAQFTNLATSGAIGVTGSGGAYTSEIDPLTASERTGSAAIDNGTGDSLANGPILVMLWLTGLEADKTDLRSVLDAAGGAVYDVLPATDPSFLALQASYPGFDTLISFTDPATTFPPGAFNWNFSAHPNVDVDQIAVVPEPASLLALAGAVVTAMRRRSPWEER